MESNSEPAFGKVLQNLDVNPDSSFVVVSYFWGYENLNRNSVQKRTYGKQVEDMADSCEKQKVNYMFVEIPEFAAKGMYQTGINYKPRFIKRALDICSPRKAIYVDSDLVFLKYPALLDVDADFFAINFQEFEDECYNPTGVWVPGGLMGFADSKPSRVLLDMFIDAMDGQEKLAEDKILSRLVTGKMLVPFLRCMWLPFSYLFIAGKHKFDEEKKEYTYVSTLKQEVKGTEYKVSDIVIYHEDLETGELGAGIYALRGIKGNRVPNNFELVMGRKLHCVDSSVFENYVDFEFDKEQQKHLAPITKLKEDANIAVPKKVPKESKFDLFDDEPIEEWNDGDSNFVVVSMYDDSVSENEIDLFMKQCEKHSLNYAIYEVKKMSKVNMPLFLKYALEREERPIVYIHISYKIKKDPLMFENASNSEIDFMMFNLNNYKSCKDPRVLRALNTDVMFWNYDERVLKFMLIWASHNSKSTYTKGYDNKTLEYAFNRSLMILKLRCIWLPLAYCANKKYKPSPIVIGTSKNRDMDHYSSALPSKLRTNRMDIEQCGQKPSLDDGNPLDTHYHGSRVTSKVKQNAIPLSIVAKFLE